MHSFALLSLVSIAFTGLSSAAPLPSPQAKPAVPALPTPPDYKRAVPVAALDGAMGPSGGVVAPASPAAPAAPAYPATLVAARGDLSTVRDDLLVEIQSVGYAVRQFQGGSELWTPETLAEAAAAAETSNAAAVASLAALGLHF